MRFEHPIFLYALILVPLAVIFLIYTERRRIFDSNKLAASNAYGRLSNNINPRKKIFKIILLVAALFFFIISAAGPQIGGKLVDVKRSGIDIFVAIDCSSSMDAQDIKPSRIGKARESFASIIDKMQGDRVGIIAFAGIAFVQCPLTLDYSAAKMLLSMVNTSLVPKPGTAIGEAIRVAIKSFPEKERKYKAMILLTDGEDHESDPLGAADEAKKEGVRIYTVGIGDPKGEPIPLNDANGNFTGYLKDGNGETVMTKIDDTLLQKIALTTGGKYFRASTSDVELDSIYDDISKMEKKVLKSTSYIKYENRYQYFAFIGLLFLIAELLISERKGIWVPWKK